MIARPAGDRSAPPVLETPRLRLRRHEPEDAGPIARLIDNWNVVRWLSQVPFPYTQADADRWIDQCHRTWAEGREYQYVIVRRDDDRAIGHIGLTLERDGRSAEFGYWLGQPYWGQGFGGEAAMAVLSIGFRSLDLDRISALCIADNHGSLQVLRKAGFVEVGRCRKAFQPQGRQLEVPVLALDRGRFEAARRVP